MMGNSYGGDDIRLCSALRVMDTYLSTQTLTSQPVILIFPLPPGSCHFFFFALLCFLSSFSTCFLIECPEVREDGEDNEASSWQRLGRRSHPQAEFTFSITTSGHISISASPTSSPLSSFWHLERQVLFRWTYLLPAGHQAKVLLSLLIIYCFSAAYSTMRNWK